MLRLVTIFCLLAVAYAASVSNSRDRDVESTNGGELETEQQKLGLLHRVPRSSHHHEGRSSHSSKSGRHASKSHHQMHHTGRTMGASGRGNVFNWDIDASSGKNHKKGTQKLETEDVSLENNMGFGK